jgi:hypothetical protein
MRRPIKLTSKLRPLPQRQYTSDAAEVSAVLITGPAEIEILALHLRAKS